MKKNAFKNIAFGLISQSIILILGLIIPRIILLNYGSDTNGFTSTITQIFSYVALLEAGIGQATRNSLYPYIKNDDKENISRVLSISKKYFKKITIFYLLTIIILSFVLPFILKTKVSYWTIAIYVLFEGLTSVVSFYFVEKWNCIFIADGRNYVKANVDLLVKTLCYVVKILLAIFSFNIALIQVGFFIVSLIKVLIYNLYAKKHYAWVNFKSDDNNEKLKDRNSYIITEIAWTIFSSTDMVILSIFISTETASIYSVYNLVFASLNMLLNACVGSVQHILGQSFSESKEKYTIIHDNFNSIICGSISILMIVSYFLIIPFVKLYTNGVNDIDYLIPGLPILFCLVQMFSWSRYVGQNLCGLGGYAKKLSYISLLEAFINLSLSIILVKFIGIIGVLLATVIALPIKVIYVNIISDKIILKRKGYKTTLTAILNFLLFFLAVIVNYFYKPDINDYFTFIIYGLIFTIISSVVVLSTNLLINKNLLKLLRKKQRKY